MIRDILKNIPAEKADIADTCKDGDRGAWARDHWEKQVHIMLGNLDNLN